MKEGDGSCDRVSVLSTSRVMQPLEIYECLADKARHL